MVHVIKRILWQLRRRRQCQPKDLTDASFSEIQDYVKSETLSGDLKDTEEQIRAAFGNSPDLTFRYMRLGANPKVEILISHLDGMVDTTFMGIGILRPIAEEPPQKSVKAPDGVAAYELLRQSLIQNTGMQEADSIEKILQYLINGFCVILIQGVPRGLAAEVRGWAERNVSEPGTESSIRGSREGFVENYRINTSMLRRIITSPQLWMEEFQIGAVTKTTITLAYVKGIAENELLEEVRHRLKSIEVDAIFESGYIEEYIEDAPYSPFPTVLRTERPDKAAAGLLEGRVVIITEGTPFALVVPATFTQFLVASEDYYERYMTGSFIRLLRLMAMFISLNPAVLLCCHYFFSSGTLAHPLDS